MTDSLWQLTEVTVSGRQRPRLADVTLTISPGVTALVGPSGAGKTTLLNLLVGFERPTAGRLEVRIESAGRLPVFWLPAGHGLWPHVSVRNHLAQIVPAADSTARVEELLHALDLASVSAAFPGTLSQGERDRLALARAVASRARVLVLDEPLAHVPVDAALRYWSWLRTEARNQTMSMVLATHDLITATREAGEIITLEGGKVVSQTKTLPA